MQHEDKNYKNMIIKPHIGKIELFGNASLKFYYASPG